MAAKKIIHIDDSALVRKNLKVTLQSLSLDSIEFAQGSNFSELKTMLEAYPNQISLLMTDLNLPDTHGFQIVEWIKTHPHYHHIPTVILSADSCEEDRQLAQKKGAAIFLQKPYTREDIHRAVSNFCQIPDAEAFKQSDLDFVTMALETINEISTRLLDKSVGYENTLMQLLHKLKGDALVADWPILAYFIHDLEDIWSFCIKNKSTDIKQLHDLTGDAVVTILNIINDIKEKKQHRVPSPNYLSDYELLKKNIEKGWVTGISRNSDKATVQESSTSVVGSASAMPDMVAQKLAVVPSEFLKIQRTQMEEIFGHIKKISQIKNKLSVFLKTLKQEFDQDPFLMQLDNQIIELASESEYLTSHFLKLRAREAQYFMDVFKKNFISIVAISSKKADLHFQIDPDLLIDSAILQVMLSASNHLLRNSLDHGQETAEQRATRNKPNNMQIRLSLSVNQTQNELNDSLKFEFSDDGQGIQLEKIKEKVIAMGLFPQDQIQDQVASFSSEKWMSFIFMDSFTTRDQASISSGRGVGLSSVKKEIEDVGGKISVKSNLSGTTFEVILPRYFRL